jgi:hypothetical protein
MKTLLACTLGLSLLLSCPAAGAGTAFYLLAGPTIADLGGDAVQIGRDLADGLTIEAGGDWRSKKGSKLGYDAGVGFLYSSPAGPLGLAAEARLARRGTSWDLTDASGTYSDVTTRVNLTYVEIPVMLQISPQTSSSVRPEFLLGPVVGIRASSSFEAEGGGGSSSVDFDDAAESAYFGGVLGAGIRIRATPTSAFLLQARMLAGLTNVLEDVTGYEAKPLDFSLLAGYSFGL